MKNKLITLFLISSSAVFMACNGDHSTRNRQDTANNMYHTDTAKASQTNLDSSKVTTTTGEATNVENSASGGAKIAKDSASTKAGPKDSVKAPVSKN